MRQGPSSSRKAWMHWQSLYGEASQNRYSDRLSVKGGGVQILAVIREKEVVFQEMIIDSDDVYDPRSHYSDSEVYCVLYTDHLSS